MAIPVAAVTRRLCISGRWPIHWRVLHSNRREGVRRVSVCGGMMMVTQARFGRLLFIDQFVLRGTRLVEFMFIDSYL